MVDSYKMHVMGTFSIILSAPENSLKLNIDVLIYIFFIFYISWVLHLLHIS
jgi:hypothetical protein